MFLFIFVNHLPGCEIKNVLSFTLLLLTSSIVRSSFVYFWTIFWRIIIYFIWIYMCFSTTFCCLGLFFSVKYKVLLVQIWDRIGLISDIWLLIAFRPHYYHFLFCPILGKASVLLPLVQIVAYTWTLRQLQPLKTNPMFDIKLPNY